MVRQQVHTALHSYVAVQGRYRSGKHADEDKSLAMEKDKLVTLSAALTQLIL